MPFIPGVDGVGRLPDGKPVYFGLSRSPFGTFAERGLAARKVCLPLPDGLDPVAAAAIVNPGMSSWVALKMRAQFVAGERVLILGATGVAGQLAVQIAKRLGASRVVAAGPNPQALEKLRDLGATSTISLDEQPASLVQAFRHEWAAGGVDVVLDYLWAIRRKPFWRRSRERDCGLQANEFGSSKSGPAPENTISLAAAALCSSGLELLGSGFGSASIGQIWKALVVFFRSRGREAFQIDIMTVPLRDVEALWNSPEQGGRLVFLP